MTQLRTEYTSRMEDWVSAAFARAVPGSPPAARRPVARLLQPTPEEAPVAVGGYAALLMFAGVFLFPVAAGLMAGAGSGVGYFLLVPAMGMAGIAVYALLPSSRVRRVRQEREGEAGVVGAWTFECDAAGARFTGTVSRLEIDWPALRWFGESDDVFAFAPLHQAARPLPKRSLTADQQDALRRFVLARMAEHQARPRQ
jgi:hypothetical protein